MLALDLQQVLSQALSFVLLLWLLRRFAWRPLLSMLDARRERIESELRRLEESKQELDRLQLEYAQRLAKIDEEARAKIQQAIAEGKRIGLEIQEEAREQGHALLTKSKETIELELAKAKVSLRDDVARMTLGAAERILQAKLDEKTDRRLIDTVLDELERETPGR